MFLAIDAYYQEQSVRVAGVGFESWEADVPAGEWVTEVTQTSAYEPGAFYKRELPGLLAMLGLVESDDTPTLTAVIVDSYVWLNADGRAGLGAHLYQAIDERIPVIGVAKNPFAANDAAIEVFRGESKRPLYVTAVGTSAEDAADALARMHGAYRVPTLLKAVDLLSRG